MNPDITLPKTPKIQRYVAKLTQEGTNAPAATVLLNTIGTVNISYFAVGRYKITMPDIIEYEDNTTLAIVGYVNLPSCITAFASWNEVEINTLQEAGTYANDILYDTHIIIEVYNI